MTDILKQMQIDHADQNLARWHNVSKQELHNMSENQADHDILTSMADVCVGQLHGVSENHKFGSALDEGADTCVRFTKHTPLVAIWSAVGKMYQDCNRTGRPGAAQETFNQSWNIQSLTSAIMTCNAGSRRLSKVVSDAA